MFQYCITLLDILKMILLQITIFIELVELIIFNYINSHYTKFNVTSFCRILQQTFSKGKVYKNFE